MIVAFVGQKGGAGKTTAAVCVASEALARGRSVLVNDADPQGTARTVFAIASEAGLPGPTIFAMGETMYRPEQLPKVSAGYDLVVIDCPPRAGDVQKAALMVADVAIIPCGPSGADVFALKGSVDLVKEAQIVRPELYACILITRKKARTTLGKGAREVLLESGMPVLETEFGDRIAYQEALTAGQGAAAYAPNDPAAAEVRALVDELEALSPIVKRRTRNARKA